MREFAISAVVLLVLWTVGTGIIELARAILGG
jgi:hypothetical protein